MRASSFFVPPFCLFLMSYLLPFSAAGLSLMTPDADSDILTHRSCRCLSISTKRSPIPSSIRPHHCFFDSSSVLDDLELSKLPPASESYTHTSAYFAMKSVVSTSSGHVRHHCTPVAKQPAVSRTTISSSNFNHRPLHLHPQSQRAVSGIMC